MTAERASGPPRRLRWFGSRRRPSWRVNSPLRPSRAEQQRQQLETDATPPPGAGTEEEDAEDAPALAAEKLASEVAALGAS